MVEKAGREFGADDGVYNKPEESFTLTVKDLNEGLNEIIFRTKDSSGLLGRAIKKIIVD